MSCIGKIFNPIVLMQFLQYTLKWNGLLSFDISMRPPHATASRIWNIYSILFTLYISFELYNSISYYLKDNFFVNIIPVDAKKTLHVVYAGLIVMSAEKSNFIYILQYWNRDKFARLINEGFELHRHICLTCKDYAVGLSAKSRAMLKTKLIATFLQVVVIIIDPFTFDSINYNVLVLIYSHFTGIAMSSTIFCGLFAVWQFYVRLNNKLRQCIAEVKILTTSHKAQQMRMQRFCDLSDHIDRLACLYARCLVFTEQLNKFFSVPLFLTLSYAFAVILSELFFIYGIFSRKIMGVTSYTPDIFYTSVLPVFVYTWEIYFTVSISNELMTQARETGIMLYSSADDMDDRLKRSVSHYVHANCSLFLFRLMKKNH